MNFIPLVSVLVHRTAGQKWHDVMWYCIGMVVDAACIFVAGWVLYHTDYLPKEERKSLLNRVPALCPAT